MARLLKLLAIGCKPEDSYLYKGGKGQATPEPQKIIPPTPPVQEAGIGLEEDEEDMGNKSKTSKASLKIPLEVSQNAGLSNTSNVGGGSSTGLKA